MTDDKINVAALIVAGSVTAAGLAAVVAGAQVATVLALCSPVVTMCAAIFQRSKS